MEQTATDDICAQVRRALLDASVPLWLPGPTADLVEIAWQKLDRDLYLTRASYGTARVLRRDPAETRRVVATVAAPSADAAGSDAIPVEMLPEDLARRCAGPNVRFFAVKEILGGGILGCVREALEVLSAVPSVLPTICSLVRALHLIDPKDDEVDVSFSKPGLPFSVFVSVPRPNGVAGTLRVAEALLHEAMHLQLTLVEAVVPLVRPTELTYFSPWRNEYRTARGVLHALYVFRVIDAFLAAAPSEAFSWDHETERRISIATQVRQIDHFRGCMDLTADGAAFVDRLLCGAPPLRARGA